MGKFVDIVGRKFFDLQVIERADNANCRRVRWKCMCECGNEKIAFSNLLQSGVTRNCGDTNKHKSSRGGAQYKFHGLSSSTKYKMYMAAKFRAKQKNIPFTLKLSEMPDIPKKCPVFGFDLEKGGNGHGLRDKSPSLDKIIPEKGYILGNVQIISGKANKMKSNATTEEIGKLYKYMLEISKKR
jgi:hypothetical protein